MSDSEEIVDHAPCRHRRRESINGCPIDMCYAIGFERVGDMPCEYCADRKKEPIHDAEA